MTSSETKAAILAAVKVGEERNGIARRYDVTLSTISGIVSRDRGYKRNRVKPPKHSANAQQPGGQDWESRLFEPWSVRKARKAMEAERGVR